MDNDYKIGQRVSIKGHKGTCYAGATGVIEDIYKCFIKVRLDNSSLIKGNITQWFPNVYIQKRKTYPPIPKN